MPKYSIHFFQEGVNYKIRKSKLVRKWIYDTMISENKTPGEISIIFCTDDYLLKINSDFLKHDTLTDIITFDYSDTISVSGDLFVSIDRIKENSKIYNKKMTDELHRVIIHGILHLCGYEDKAKKKKEIMTMKENYYLGYRPDELLVSLKCST